MLEFVHLVLDLLQMAKCCQRGFVNRRAGFKMYMLSEQAKTNAAGANYVASVSRTSVPGLDTATKRATSSPSS